MMSSIPGMPIENSTPSFVLSLLPSSFQNLLHIPLYAGLCSSCLWGANKGIRSKKVLNILVFLICTAFALSDEIHQTNIIGRHGSLSDFILDVVGVILGLLTYPHNRKILQKKST